MKPRAPRFLERRGYRLRRVMDAARVLPLFGLAVFLLPVLWDGGTTRGGVVFLFLVWALLIVVSALIARILGPEVAPPGDDENGGRG